MSGETKQKKKKNLNTQNLIKQLRFPNGICSLCMFLFNLKIKNVNLSLSDLLISNLLKIFQSETNKHFYLQKLFTFFWMTPTTKEVELDYIIFTLSLWGKGTNKIQLIYIYLYLSYKSSQFLFFLLLLSFFFLFFFFCWAFLFPTIRKSTPFSFIREQKNLKRIFSWRAFCWLLACLH